MNKFKYFLGDGITTYLEEGKLKENSVPISDKQIKSNKFTQDFVNYIQYVKDNTPKLTQTGNHKLKDIGNLCDIFEDRMKMTYGPDDEWEYRTENKMPYLLKIDVLANEIMKLTRRYKGRKRITKLGKKYLDLPVSWQYFNLFINYWNEFNWAYPRAIGYAIEMAQDLRHGIRKLLVDYNSWSKMDYFKMILGQYLAVEPQITQDWKYKRDIREAAKIIIEILNKFDLN